MFNNKKIEELKNQINDLTEKFEQAENLNNEKIANLDSDFQALKNDTQNIVNFNETYNKIIEGYNNSKNLINEQLLQYDKKIIENTGVVDSRLLSFQSKIDTALDQTLGDLKQKLVDDNLKNRKNLLSLEDEVKNKLMSLEVELKNNIETKFKDEFSKNDDKFNLQNENNEKVIKGEIEKLKTNFNQIVTEHQKIWNESHLKYTNDINHKLNKYDLNLNEMINNAVLKKLNAITVSEVSNKATDEILTAFNNSLKELNEDEKSSIIEAIKAHVSSKLPEIKKEENEEEIKPLGKDELFHQSYDKLKLCVQADIIPMLVGPAGTGKSTAAEQLARDLGMKFYMANRIQNTFELVGFQNAAGKYQPTQFYEAYKNGGIFLFDEVDASSPEALVTINAAIAQGHMSFPGHTAVTLMHKDFKAICAGNTFGTGSTLQYTGRNKLDAATLDRFMIIEWDYDRKLEEKLVKDKNLLELCWTLRDVCPTIDQNIIISTRGIALLDKLIKINELTNNHGLTFKLKDLFRQKFFENISKDKMKRIYEAIKDKCPKNTYLNCIKELSQ